VSGYVLVVGNHIEHLPLTSLRVIRGKSLLNVKVPSYAAATTTDRPSTTAAPSYTHDDDDGGWKTGVWNVSVVYEDVDWRTVSVEDDRTDSWTTASDSRGDDRLPCSLFIASNGKVSSTSIGLKEIQLTSLHGQCSMTNIFVTYSRTLISKHGTRLID